MKHRIYCLLLLLLSVAIVRAQTKQVTGRVTTETGDGIPGVTVTVKGTDNATRTNQDGSIPVF